MFPVSMATQRDRLVGALGRIVSRVDQLDEVVEFIQQLGRDHRRFEVVAAHYGAVGASLLATLKHFLGERWTDEVAADWAAAYGVIATVMVEAAEASERTSPASWAGHVTAVERRGLDIAVIQVRPEPDLSFAPGQSVAMEIPSRPRLWRYLSPANAPRSDGTLEFHVQLVPGGQVSSTIVRNLEVGETVRLGAPVGQELTLDEAERERDLIMVAAGAGLAPLRSHLERIDQEWQSTGRGSSGPAVPRGAVAVEPLREPVAPEPGGPALVHLHTGGFGRPHVPRPEGPGRRCRRRRWRVAWTSRDGVRIARDGAIHGLPPAGRRGRAHRRPLRAVHDARRRQSYPAPSHP